MAYYQFLLLMWRKIFGTKNSFHQNFFILANWTNNCQKYDLRVIESNHIINASAKIDICKYMFSVLIGSKNMNIVPVIIAFSVIVHIE